MNHIFCIHPSVERHVGYFQLLAITNKATMNTVEHVSLWHGEASSGYTPRNGRAGSSWNPQIDFQSGCTSLQSNNNGGMFLFLHILVSMFCYLRF
jgi:hypothetical protein